MADTIQEVLINAGVTAYCPGGISEGRRDGPGCGEVYYDDTLTAGMECDECGEQLVLLFDPTVTLDLKTVIEAAKAVRQGIQGEAEAGERLGMGRTNVSGAGDPSAPEGGSG